MRYTKRDRHDLDGEDAYLTIALLIRRIDFGEEVDIRIQANTDAVDKENRKARRSCVWPIPIG